jgi:hypothetical protein
LESQVCGLVKPAEIQSENFQNNSRLETPLAEQGLVSDPAKEVPTPRLSTPDYVNNKQRQGIREAKSKTEEISQRVLEQNKGIIGGAAPLRESPESKKKEDESSKFIAKEEAKPHLETAPYQELAQKPEKSSNLETQVRKVNEIKPEFFETTKKGTQNDVYQVAVFDAPSIPESKEIIPKVQQNEPKMLDKKLADPNTLKESLEEAKPHLETTPHQKLAQKPEKISNLENQVSEVGEAKPKSSEVTGQSVQNVVYQVTNLDVPTTLESKESQNASKLNERPARQKIQLSLPRVIEGIRLEKQYDYTSSDESGKVAIVYKGLKSKVYLQGNKVMYDSYNSKSQEIGRVSHGNIVSIFPDSRNPLWKRSINNEYPGLLELLDNRYIVGGSFKQRPGIIANMQVESLLVEEGPRE